MSQNKSRAASLRHTLIVALFSIGTLFFFFPIADAGTGGYMTAVPMFCRLVLAAAVFPFLAGRAGQHMAQTGAWLYSSGGSKLERPGAVILGSIAGPICFVPLVASLSANQLLAAVGQPGSPVFRVVLVVLLVAAAYTVAECRELSRAALAGMLAAVAAGIAAFVVLLGSGAAAAPEAAPTGKTYLESNIAVLLALAPTLLQNTGEPGERKPFWKDSALVPFAAGILLSAAGIAAVAVAAYRCPNGAGCTLSEILVAGIGNPAGRVLAAIFAAILGIALMAMGFTSGRRWLAAASLESSDGAASADAAWKKWLPPVLAVLLAMPVIGDVWLKAAEALLAAAYPIAAVPMIFYAVVPKPDEERKQFSLKFAFTGALVYSVIMLVYFLTQNYGIEAVLLQGIYEHDPCKGSSYMARGVCAAVCHRRYAVPRKKGKGEGQSAVIAAESSFCSLVFNQRITL